MSGIFSEPRLGSRGRLNLVSGVVLSIFGGALLALAIAGQLRAQALAPPGSGAEYASWIGKRFVRRTKTYNGSESIVREADVPRPYRIFTPNRSIGDMMYDANRTNIFLDQRSIIIKVSKG